MPLWLYTKSGGALETRENSVGVVCAFFRGVLGGIGDVVIGRLVIRVDAKNTQKWTGLGSTSIHRRDYTMKCFYKSREDTDNCSYHSTYSLK